MRHTGRNDGDADAISKAIVKGRANDDIRIGVDLLTHAHGGRINLVQGQIMAADNGDQQAPRSFQRDIVEQRVVDGFFSRKPGAVFAGGLARSHHRAAHALQHCFDVGQIEIDEAFLDDQVDDASDAGIKHLVRQNKRLGKRRLFI